MTDSVDSPAPAEPRRTPLYDSHVALAAKIIDFGGWAMPLQYPSGILAEHRNVREHVGLFDVSHMGEVTFDGPRAAEAVQKLVTADIANLKDGRAVYCVACRPNGTIIDDLIVYRASATSFLIVINAANVKKDVTWFHSQVGSLCDVRDISDETALISVQGPRAVELCAELTDPQLADVPAFGWRAATLSGMAVKAARTGYTGEDGFELFCSVADAPRVWETLLARGRSYQVKPIGLGARDTLRLEAKLSLYGNDLDEEHTPHQAGLSWVVKGTGFIGEAALAAEKAAGVERKLVGFVMRDRFVARHGYDIVLPGDSKADSDNDKGPASGALVGVVTSGAPGPSIGQNIGMGYVPTEHAAVGTRLVISGRGKTGAAEVVAGAFYKRAK